MPSIKLAAFVGALALALASPALGAVTPAAAIAVSGKGLEYAAATARPVVVEQLNSVKIGSTSTHVDGFDIKIDHIACSSFALASLDLAPQAGAGLSLVVGGVTAKCRAKWGYRAGVWPHLPRGDGWIDMNIASGTHVDVDIALKPRAGTLSLKSTKCKASVQLSNLKFSEGVTATLLNLFKGKMEPTIASAIAGPVCDSVNGGINHAANDALATLSPAVAVPLPATVTPLSVDFSLLAVSTGAASPSFLSLMLRGAASGGGASPPPAAAALPTHDEAVGTKMAEVLLLPYTFESIAAAMIAAGEASVSVTNAMVPPEVPFRLTADTFADNVPGMAAMYPGNPSLQIDLSLAETPSLAVGGGELAFAAPLRVGFSVVVEAPEGLAPLFSLSCTLKGGVALRVEHGALKGELEGVGCGGMALLDNDTGANVNVGNLDMLTSYVIVPQAVDAANGVLEKGFALPSFDGVSLVGAELDLDGPYLRVATDVTYAAPPVVAQEARPVFSVLGEEEEVIDAKRLLRV